MSDITIGVVADMRRQEQAWMLSNAVDAKVLSYDDGTMGTTKNHIKVWTKVLQHGGNWAVVLEDDAVLCESFQEQLSMALANPPADVVGLYLGRSFPTAWQRFIKKAMTDEDANYIVSSHLLHGVGTAIRMPYVADMLRFVGHMSPTESLWPVDEQITHWCRMRGHRVCYTKPSIVDHGDGPTLLEHVDGTVRKSPRVAWEFGTREFWNPYRTVEMP